MTIAVGDTLPDATFVAIGPNGPEPKSTSDIFGGRKVAPQSSRPTVGSRGPGNGCRSIQLACLDGCRYLDQKGHHTELRDRQRDERVPEHEVLASIEVGDTHRDAATGVRQLFESVHRRSKGARAPRRMTSCPRIGAVIRARRAVWCAHRGILPVFRWGDSR